jgi:hypothetical protein
MNAVPLADADALASAARRTAVVRVALGAAIAAALVAAFLSAREPAAPAAAADARASTIVVVDVSFSISPDSYSRIAATLRSLLERGRPIGLVAFSDSAYEVLPPGTPAEELRPLLRFFNEQRAGALQNAEARDDALATPWSVAFSGGTRISAALSLARRLIERDGIRPASVVLLSDLENPAGDRPAVTHEAARYRAAGIGLRLVPLAGTASDRSLYALLLGPAQAAIGPPAAPRAPRSHESDPPAMLVAAVGVLLLLLGVNEHWCRRLRWRIT